MTTINYKHLQNVCLAKIKAFKGLGEVTETRDGIYIYKENPKAKILAVAHLDTVLGLKHFYKTDIGNDTYIYNAQLDDRLGVYVLLEVLPQMGIEYDLLLTEGEEQGLSTAEYFSSSKDYNWMFSFDRHGDDVVMYHYDTKELRDDLSSVKMIPARGSFSDIVFLDHLGIRGFNVGTGYEDEHFDLCYASMNTLHKQIKRFKAFYDKFQDKKYPYSYTPMTGIQQTSHRSQIVYPRQEWVQCTDDECCLCHGIKDLTLISNDLYLCSDCFGEASECTQCHDIVYADELTDGICLECLEGRDDG